MAEGVKRRARGQGSSAEKRSRTSSSTESVFRPPSAASVYGQNPDPGSGSSSQGPLFGSSSLGLTSVPASQVTSLAFTLATGSGETTFSSVVPRVSSGFLPEGLAGLGTVGSFSPRPVRVAESVPTVSASQVPPPQADLGSALRKEMDEFKQTVLRMNQDLLKQVMAHTSGLSAGSSNAPEPEPPVRAARASEQPPSFGFLPSTGRDLSSHLHDHHHRGETRAYTQPDPYDQHRGEARVYAQSDLSEADSEQFVVDDQASEGSWESDASEQRFPTSSSDDPSTAEIQAVLGVLKDSAGLLVAPAVEQPSGWFTSSRSVSKPTLSIPVPSEFRLRADNLAASSCLKDRPDGALIPIAEDANSVLASSQPIPDDAWDRLIAFKKAKVSASSTTFLRRCRLADAEQDRTHRELRQFNHCASHGITASMLLIYVVEWFNREEQGLLFQQPSSSVRALMLGMLAKLSRRCMDQFLRVSFHATRLRRAQILPLLGLPEIARQRFRALSPVGSDLFGGAFQATVSNEAERVKTLKETTIPSLSSFSGRSNPFRGDPSRQASGRREGRPAGARGQSGGGQQRRRFARFGRTGTASSVPAASGTSGFQRQSRGGARKGSKSRRGGRGKA